MLRRRKKCKTKKRRKKVKIYIYIYIVVQVYLSLVNQLSSSISGEKREEKKKKYASKSEPYIVNADPTHNELTESRTTTLCTTDAVKYSDVLSESIRVQRTRVSVSLVLRRRTLANDNFKREMSAKK